jgi:hypothetical protein
MGQDDMGIAQVVARQPRPAVEQEDHLVARPVTVGHDLVAVDLDTGLFVRMALVGH